MNGILFELLTKVKGKIADKEFDKAYNSFKRFKRLSDIESVDKLDELLDALTEYAIHNSPFYGNVKYDANSGRDRLSSFSELSKEDIRKYSDKIKAADFTKHQFQTRKSGGTTGEPTEVFVDRFTSSMEVLTAFQGFKWMGWKPGEPIIRLFGGSLGTNTNKSWQHRFRNYFLRESFLPAFELSTETLPTYVSHIKKYNNCTIMGYASALNNLAIYCINNEIEFTNVKNVFTTAEMLAPEWRDNIKSIFNCSVKSYYGCGEIESLGFQEEENGPYRVPFLTNYLEVNSKNELLVTSLHNRCFPLIRYRNGDRATLLWQDDKLYIHELHGRIADQLVTTNGEFVSGILAQHAVYKLLLPIERYQIIQDEPNRIGFFYIKGADDFTNKTKADCAKVLKSFLGEDMTIHFEQVEKMKLTKAGKYRIVINNLLN